MRQIIYGQIGQSPEIYYKQPIKDLYRKEEYLNECHEKKRRKFIGQPNPK